MWNYKYKKYYIFYFQLQIISLCDALNDELQKFNINNNSNIVVLTRNAIDNILNKDKYDVSGFNNQFLNYNKDFIGGLDGSSLDFIETLINKINQEFFDIKYKLCDKNDINFKSKDFYVMREFHQFIKKESIASKIFSFISKKLIYNMKIRRTKNKI